MVNLKTLQDIKIGDDKATVFIDTLYDDTAKAYLKYHRDWYLNERFARGDHWVVYNKTLNKMHSKEIKVWANSVLNQLKKSADIKNDKFTFLAGNNYRKFLLPHIKHYKITSKC